MHRINRYSLYERFIIMNYCIIFLFLLSLSCNKRDDQTSSICFPYRISDKIVTRTEYPTEFGMIRSSINADIEYHVLSDASMHPYITIQGPENFVDRINCTSIYDSRYDRNEISLTYDRCMTRKRNPRLNIHIYGHKLFQIIMMNSNFVSRDTIQSNDGFLKCFLYNAASMEITCNVPNLSMLIYNHNYFICHGIVDYCKLDMFSAAEDNENVSVNLESLKYRSLYYLVEPAVSSKKPAKLYVGRPDTIYYQINSPDFNLYYQGDPVLIDKGSPFFTLFKKD
jgi:hypothetical protein